MKIIRILNWLFCKHISTALSEKSLFHNLLLTIKLYSSIIQNWYLLKEENILDSVVNFKYFKTVFSHYFLWLNWICHLNIYFDLNNRFALFETKDILRNSCHWCSVSYIFKIRNHLILTERIKLSSLHLHLHDKHLRSAITPTWKYQQNF